MVLIIIEVNKKYCAMNGVSWKNHRSGKTLTSEWPRPCLPWGTLVHCLEPVPAGPSGIPPLTSLHMASSSPENVNQCLRKCYTSNPTYHTPKSVVLQNLTFFLEFSLFKVPNSFCIYMDIKHTYFTSYIYAITALNNNLSTSFMQILLRMSQLENPEISSFIPHFCTSLQFYWSNSFIYSIQYWILYHEN